MISGIAERRDATKALKEAWEELDDDYGSETIPAKERLAHLLEQGAIDPNNAEAHMLLSAELRRIYERAKSGGTQAQFDEPEVIQQILAIKLPGYHDLFLEKMEARMEREERESDQAADETRLRHLIDHIKRRAKLLMVKAKWKPDNAVGTNKANTNSNSNNSNTNTAPNTNYGGNRGAKMPANNQGGKSRANIFATNTSETTSYDSYGTAVREGTPQQQQPKEHVHDHGSCGWCKGDHCTVKCPSFWNDLNPLERLDEFNKAFWCYNCASPDHGTRDCPEPRAKCELCGKPHLTVLHRDTDARARQKVNLGHFIPIGQKPLEPTNRTRTKNNNGSVNNNNGGDGTNTNNRGETNTTEKENNNGTAAAQTNPKSTTQGGESPVDITS